MVSVKKQRHAGRMYMIHAYLLIGLALAVAHRQLRVDERRAGGHLEGARLAGAVAVHALRDGDLARILLLEEGGQRGGVLGVPSAASVLDADPELRHGGKGSPDRGGKKRDDLVRPVACVVGSRRVSAPVGTALEVTVCY